MGDLIFDEVDIADNGAILLGEQFVCEAHHPRPVRIITHAHADHMLHIKTSLNASEKVIATPITRDYGQTFEYGGEKVTLFPAFHIPGSAQVLLENGEKSRILYTGDFRYPGAKIIETDILVTEATYGNPECVRDFADTVGSELIQLVKQRIEEGPVYIFGYYGKVQEVVKILNESDVDFPILVPEKIFQILNVCQKHGSVLKDYYLSKSKTGEEIRRSRHIGVYHMGASRWVGQDGVRVVLSGWQFDVPCKQIGERKYQVALSDHADFKHLIEYIEQVRPRLVVTDGYRARDASLLALEIQNRLGIHAVSLPR
jgi:putative mRNA 3-end processing factor